ncbi:UNVERIFIED_CONTAM: hypothetical protein PYX00_010182 [Menopon gallinae]|uniref:Uncharacterized protein n=1 Tax=Menopon gallinae TaxID=328185 RepID=A0AAW2HE84_9NEOP
MKKSHLRWMFNKTSYPIRFSPSVPLIFFEVIERHCPWKNEEREGKKSGTGVVEFVQFWNVAGIVEEAESSGLWSVLCVYTETAANCTSHTLFRDFLPAVVTVPVGGLGKSGNLGVTTPEGCDKSQFCYYTEQKSGKK